MNEGFAGVEVWRGGVNTWECDEMGHMNVRFYVTRAQEALAGLARHLGMPHAFAPDASATLVVRRHHVRFLAEAHAGAPLAMQAGVIGLDETGADLLFLLQHRDGRLCASFQTRVEHATPQGRAFPWPDRARVVAERLVVIPPEQARARSIDLSLDLVGQASTARADALELACIARGVVGPGAGDPFGRMQPAELIGRISDGVPTLLSDLRRLVKESSPDQPQRMGGAVLENRLDYVAYPKVGDHVEIRSGLAEVTDRFQRMIHWMFDPVSGRLLAVSEAVAVNLDLDRRKVVAISADARAALAQRIKPGLLPTS